jgi:hypothetical protein
MSETLLLGVLETRQSPPFVSRRVVSFAFLHVISLARRKAQMSEQLKVPKDHPCAGLSYDDDVVARRRVDFPHLAEVTDDALTCQLQPDSALGKQCMWNLPMPDGA